MDRTKHALDCAAAFVDACAARTPVIREKIKMLADRGGAVREYEVVTIRAEVDEAEQARARGENLIGQLGEVAQDTTDRILAAAKARQDTSALEDGDAVIAVATGELVAAVHKWKGVEHGLRHMLAIALPTGGV